MHSIATHDILLEKLTFQPIQIQITKWEYVWNENLKQEIVKLEMEIK